MNAAFLAGYLSKTANPAGTLATPTPYQDNRSLPTKAADFTVQNPGLVGTGAGAAGAVGAYKASPAIRRPVKMAGRALGKAFPVADAGMSFTEGYTGRPFMSDPGTQTAYQQNWLPQPSQGMQNLEQPGKAIGYTFGYQHPENFSTQIPQSTSSFIGQTYRNTAFPVGAAAAYGKANPYLGAAAGLAASPVPQAAGVATSMYNDRRNAGRIQGNYDQMLAGMDPAARERYLSRMQAGQKASPQKDPNMGMGKRWNTVLNPMQYYDAVTGLASDAAGAAGSQATAAKQQAKHDVTTAAEDAYTSAEDAVKGKYQQLKDWGKGEAVAGRDWAMDNLVDPVYDHIADRKRADTEAEVNKYIERFKPWLLAGGLGMIGAPIIGGALSGAMSPQPQQMQAPQYAGNPYRQQQPYAMRLR